MKTSILILSIILSTNLFAAETDQFYARDAVIKDSSQALNDFFNSKIDLAVEKVNKKGNVNDCKLVSAEIFDQLLGEVNLIEWYKDKTFSKVSWFTQNSPLVERFPLDSVSNSEFRTQSIYKNRPFPFNVVSVGRTINVNNIYMGTDKIGHFSIVGKTYYKHYIKNLKEGMNEKDAEVAAIKQGIKEEINFLGYKLGGTLSYGDLEANYQGLQFGLEVCNAKDPFVKNENGTWKRTDRLFDIRKYANPKFDEAYNYSFWSPRIWGKLKNDIFKAYCANKSNKNFLERLKMYKGIIKANQNDDLIAHFVKENPEYDRKTQLDTNDKSKCEI